jgi:hypothetical protein
MPMPGKAHHAKILALLAGGLFGAPADAQEAIDMRLSSAGFVIRAADTPAKMARLKHLPARKIVARVKDGKPFYVYADPDYCRCAMVGDAIAMQQFRDMNARQSDLASGPQGRSVETQVIDQMSGDIDSFEPDDIFKAPF